MLPPENIPVGSDVPGKFAENFTEKSGMILFAKVRDGFKMSSQKNATFIVEKSRDFWRVSTGETRQTRDLSLCAEGPLVVAKYGKMRYLSGL